MASCDESNSVKFSSEESYQMECSPCENDGVVKEAEYFCTECQEYLCQSCETLHKRFKGTKNHTVSQCADIKIESQEDASTIACSCKRNDVEIYCEYHNDAVCSDCKMTNHRLCKTKSVDAVISEQKTDFDIKTLTFADHVKGDIEKLVTERKQSLEQLQVDTDHAREEMISFGNKLKNRIDSLQENALTDLKTYSGRHYEVVEHHLTACETALKSLSFDCSNHQRLKESQNRRRKFLTHIKLTQTLKDVNVLAADIKKEIYEPSLYFERNEDLSAVLNFDDFGSVKHNLRKQPRSFSADMTVKSSREVTVRISSDEKSPWISGSVFLPNGELILCDRNNNCLKLFDTEFISKQDHLLQGHPRDCCLVNQNEVLVTFPEMKQIQRYQTSPIICLKNTMNFNKKCVCVDSLNQDIFVTCLDDADANLKEIQIIDPEGNLKRKIALNEDDSSKILFPYYIAVSEFGQIYVSESNNRTNATQIRCFESYGVCRYKLAREDLGGTGGLLVDEEGRLLVCFSKSNTLQVISKDGTKSHTFLDSGDDERVNGPYSACFRKTDATLVLVPRDKNYMLIFEMKLA